MAGTGANVVGIELYTTGKNSNIWTIGFNSVEYLYFIEDLFSFCMSGKICFNDVIGISEFGPLNGSEKLKVRFGNTENTSEYRTVIFDIQKIEKIERNAGLRPASTNKVTLVLVDTYYRKLHSKFWSKSWVDTKISDIITDICKNHVGIEEFVLFEETQEKLEYFDSHLRTPAECISWLMNRASGSTTKQPGYLFYNGNTQDGEEFGHRFTTLEQLMVNTKWMKPYDTTIDGKSSEIASYLFENPNPDYINKIYDHKVLTVDLAALKSLSGGTLLGWDIRRKKLIKQVYTYQDAIDRFTILGKKTLFPIELNLDHPTVKVDGYSDEAILDNIWYGNWVKEYAHQQLVHLTVNGHEKRHCGGMIRVVWPTHQEVGDVPQHKREYFNRQMDGRYLIKSITHYFDKNLTYGWQQKLVCIKNGYKESPNPNLVLAKKRNL